MKRITDIEVGRNQRTKILAGLATLLVATWLVMSPEAGAQEGRNQLEAIEVATMPGDQVQLRLRLSDTAPDPLSFTIDNPARIALDLRDTRIALEDRMTEIGVGAIRSVMTAEAKGRTRVVVNLSDLVPYQTRTEGNNVYITLGASTVAATPVPTQTFGPASEPAQPQAQTPPRAQAQAASPRPSFTPPQTQPRGKSINAIDFRRGDEGEGRVMVTLSDPRTVVDVRQEGGEIIVDFRGASLPDNLIQRYDVLDFATPVKTIDAIRDAG
ncbi:MAG: AMIN domain-containing protein, partial [Gammaproteobacteria bacterium]|nr:AMIN domain-containing protein [Gammaproteobacteria bacterium]